MDNDTRRDFLYGLLHGYRFAFETCELITEALSYKKAIPKSFWVNELKETCIVLGAYRISKKEMRKLKEEAVTAIAEKISYMEKENSKKNQVDNFSRLFHALTILKVEKNTLIVPAIGENLIYNAVYMLWVLDDGNEKSWKTIDAVSWYVAEAIKSNSCTRNGLLTGRRHE